MIGKYKIEVAPVQVAFWRKIWTEIEGLIAGLEQGGGILKAIRNKNLVVGSAKTFPVGQVVEKKADTICPRSAQRPSEWNQ